MIIDTSAIMAILFGEPSWEDFGRLIVEISGNRISAGTWIEVSAVVTRRGDPGLAAAVRQFRSDFDLQIMPVTVEQAEIGHAAYCRYGRGSEHPARLNLGDCFAYALAKETGEPLLFKGDDFVHTDVTPALR